MPFMDVKHYSVSRMLFKGGFGQTSFITMKLDDPTMSVVIYFFPNFTASDIGQVSAGIVSGYASDGDFGYYHHILQTEKPLFFGWELADGSDRLQWYRLTSTAEPLGEGLRDLSP
jgi:hypothetical protein